MTIRAVLLDAGDTLITPRRPLADELALSVPGGEALPAADVRRRFEEVWTERCAALQTGQERYRTVPGGAMQYWREVFIETFRRLRVDLAADVADGLYRRLCEPTSWRIFPEVTAVLLELRRRGLVLAVASNWDRGLPSILDGLGLTPHFQALGVSGIVGHEKPAAAFFHAVLAEIGVAPEEAVHVGDRWHDDVEGARGAGIQGFLIDRRGRFEDAPWVLRSLDELPDRLTL